jgi:hypothetical protein
VGLGHNCNHNSAWNTVYSNSKVAYWSIRTCDSTLGDEYDQSPNNVVDGPPNTVRKTTNPVIGPVESPKIEKVFQKGELHIRLNYEGLFVLSNCYHDFLLVDIVNTPPITVAKPIHWRGSSESGLASAVRFVQPLDLHSNNQAAVSLAQLPE